MAVQNRIMLQLLSGSYNNRWSIVSVSTMRYLVPSVVMILYVSWSTVTISIIRNHAPPFSFVITTAGARILLKYMKTMRLQC